jgi:hypothetical protein
MTAQTKLRQFILELINSGNGVTPEIDVRILPLLLVPQIIMSS